MILLLKSHHLINETEHTHSSGVFSLLFSGFPQVACAGFVTKYIYSRAVWKYKYEVLKGRTVFFTLLIKLCKYKSS